MPRSISARIFSGFLLVTIAFGAVMGYAVYRMSKVRQQLTLINESYLKLNFILGELRTIQHGLLYVSDQRAAGLWPSDPDSLRQVELARRYRLHHVRRAAQLVQGTAGFDPSVEDQRFLARTERRLAKLLRAFRDSEPLFDELFDPERTGERLRALGDRLLPTEQKLQRTTRRLSDEISGRVTEAAVVAEAAERSGIWAGLGLVLLALAVSLVVTFRARRTLRPLATLVDGTKRIGSGDYAQRVQVTSHDELGLLATEFNNMAAAIEEREARLIRSERLAAAGRLASHITHEVRNPLNSISLNTEMLEEELGAAVGEPDEARALCRAIRQEVDRLTDITEEYLRFARLPKPTLQEEDVDEILSSLLSFMAEELKEADVSLGLALGGVPPIQADEAQLRQAFLNLVRNAAEAMSGIGGSLQVRTGLDGTGQVEIEIADTGPGISAEALGQVFEPFFSTKEGGTGLGLALTQQIVVEHGGNIAVRSDPEQGTVFTVCLPVATRPG